MYATKGEPEDTAWLMNSSDLLPICEVWYLRVITTRHRNMQQHISVNVAACYRTSTSLARCCGVVAKTEVDESSVSHRCHHEIHHFVPGVDNFSLWSERFNPERIR